MRNPCKRLFKNRAFEVRELKLCSGSSPRAQGFRFSVRKLRRGKFKPPINLEAKLELYGVSTMDSVLKLLELEPDILQIRFYVWYPPYKRFVEKASTVQQIELRFHPDNPDDVDKLSLTTDDFSLKPVRETELNNIENHLSGQVGLREEVEVELSLRGLSRKEIFDVFGTSYQERWLPLVNYHIGPYLYKWSLIELAVRTLKQIYKDRLSEEVVKRFWKILGVDDIKVNLDIDDVIRLLMDTFQAYLWDQVLRAYLESRLPEEVLRTVMLGSFRYLIPEDHRVLRDVMTLSIPLPSAASRADRLYWAVLADILNRYDLDLSYLSLRLGNSPLFRPGKRTVLCAVKPLFINFIDGKVFLRFLSNRVYSTELIFTYLMTLAGH